MRTLSCRRRTTEPYVEKRQQLHQLHKDRLHGCQLLQNNASCIPRRSRKAFSHSLIATNNLRCRLALALSDCSDRNWYMSYSIDRYRYGIPRRNLYWSIGLRLSLSLSLSLRLSPSLSLRASERIESDAERAGGGGCWVDAVPRTGLEAPQHGRAGVWARARGVGRRVHWEDRTAPQARFSGVHAHAPFIIVLIRVAVRADSTPSCCAECGCAGPISELSTRYQLIPLHAKLVSRREIQFGGVNMNV